MVRLTVTNDGGFTSHQETTVNAKPSVEESCESDNTELIIGLVISLIAVLVLVAAVAFLLCR